jgi:hypothetical protein
MWATRAPARFDDPRSVDIYKPRGMFCSAISELKEKGYVEETRPASTAFRIVEQDGFFWMELLVQSVLREGERVRDW